MKFIVNVVVAVIPCLCTAVIASAQQVATPQKREPLKIARIYADAKGETHWETITILTEPPGPTQAGGGPAETLASLGLPLTGKLTFHRIAGNLVIPNPPEKPHFAPYRTWIFVLSGSGFWWNVGNTKVEFKPGGTVLLADDTDSKGHNTAALGTETTFMFVPIAGGPAPSKPCANAPSVLNCLLGT